MTRQWTIEELDRVHPLPDGWEWSDDFGDGWYAVNGDAARVLVDSVGRLCCDDIDGEDADVALAVILASKGLDSYEAMADAMEQRAAYFDAHVRRDAPTRDGAAVSASELMALSKEQWMLITSAVQSMRGRAGLKPDTYRAIDSLAAQLASACPLCGGEHRVDKCETLTAKPGLAVKVVLHSVWFEQGNVVRVRFSIDGGAEQVIEVSLSERPHVHSQYAIGGYVARVLRAIADELEARGFRDE